MSASIKVINRSAWPTWLVRWIVRKACADAGVKRYEWIQRRCTTGQWSGSSSRYAACGRVDRRCKPARRATYLHSDHRWQGQPVEAVPHTSVAVLAFLIRHEVQHAVDWPSEWHGRTGRTDVQLMEDACNEAAGRFVRALQADWPSVLGDWLRLARAERQRSAAPSPDLRLAKLRDKHGEALRTWERKLKLAQGKVRKYRQRVAATDRRMAATRNTPTPS